MSDLQKRPSLPLNSSERLRAENKLLQQLLEKELRKQ